MKSIDHVVYFTTIILIQHGVICLPETFLSSPGNSSILVFLDLHRSHHGNTCADPDWSILELAQSLHWKAKIDQTGIEIYDTCSSPARVTMIARERFAEEEGHSGTTVPISGVLSYSTKTINDILKFSFDFVIIMVEDSSSAESDTEQTDGLLYAELASKSNAEVLAYTLHSLNWTYVTTFSDNHPQSLSELATFQRVADDLNICIQFSQIIANFTSNDVVSVRTDGVVVFANDLRHLKNVAEKLPKGSAVAIATHDRSTSEFRFVNSGIVLSDAYDHNENLSEYMSMLWNQTKLDEISTQYYVTNHNCSFINQSVNSQISCNDIQDMQAYFNRFTSSRRMHVFYETLDLLASVTNDMVKNGCTDYDRSCLNPADINRLSTYLQLGNNKTLVSKPPYKIKLTVLSGGNAQKADLFSSANFTDIASDVYKWIGDAPDSFPTSLCTVWCPSCQRSKDDNSLSHPLNFEGEYLFVPGDILLAGMIPLSQNWNPMSRENVCTGMLLDSSFYIQSEAFLYAVLSAQSRHGDRMQNLSIGVLLFDTCNDVNRASQILLNFESDLYNFKRKGNHWRPSPGIVPAYVLVGNGENFMGEAQSINKLALGVNDHGSIYKNQEILYDSSTFEVDIVVKFLHALNLTSVGLVTSKTTDGLQVQGFFEAARARNICISYHDVISTQNSELINKVKTSSANVVIVYANSDDVEAFFRSLTTERVVKTWVLIETRRNWLDISAFPLPLGSVILSPEGKQNPEFNEHMNNITDSKPVDVVTNNPWIRNVSSTISKSVTNMQASDLIKAVDISLETIVNAVTSVCGNKSGLCPEFFETGAQQVMQELDNRKTGSNDHQTYIISNLQEVGTVEVGKWSKQRFSLDKAKLKSYDSRGKQLAEFRQSYCFVKPCGCMNINTTADTTDTAKMRQLDYEMGYKNSSAKFQKDLWVLIVVIIAGTGSLLTLTLMVYIMCKVCAGALMRRYLALGILLLVGMVFLFLSVLPFLFSPSETVCGMRFFAHGFSYAFCYAIMLTKMMSLRDYKYIGLGGEISRINQMLTVFFITSVQVAIGVQWWVLKTPVLYTEAMFEAGENDALLETTYYACDFVRKDFVSYHSYVIFLLVLCCLYSLGVRKETKNMNEARLLLICSWFCLALWIGIVVTLMILDRKYLEAICAIGILANALSMVVIIYLPKLTAISRLKYDVSEQKAHKENGYKLDPDFQFERPYSLPGTLHSSITDKALTYPRSLATFDTSLSY